MSFLLVFFSETQSVCRSLKALSDYTDLLSRRLGFIPLPFACLVFGVLFQTLNIKTTLSIINLILTFFW